MNSSQHHVDQIQQLTPGVWDALNVDNALHISDETALSSTESNRFRLYRRKDLSNIPEPTYCVRGILPMTGFACVYGAPGTGKSFLVLALAYAIAGGTDFFGRETTSAPVVYIPLENRASLKIRVEAIEQHNGYKISDNFHYMGQDLNLLDSRIVEELGKVLPKGSVIIIDTLNRATPGAEENASKDMGSIIAAANVLQKATGGLVIFVHHPGKDDSKGPRGHSSLLGALDASILVERSGNGNSWTLKKSKDGEGEQKFAFRLKVEILGKDSKSNPITSCAVEELELSNTNFSDSLGDTQMQALETIRTALKSPAVFKILEGHKPCLRVEDSVSLVKSALGTKCRTPSRARDLIENLIRKGRLQAQNEGDTRLIWLT